jgi:hypothetical protein
MVRTLALSLPARPTLGVLPTLAGQALACLPVLGCALALICAGRALPF